MFVNCYRKVFQSSTAVKLKNSFGSVGEKETKGHLGTVGWILGRFFISPFKIYTVHLGAFGSGVPKSEQGLNIIHGPIKRDYLSYPKKTTVTLMGLEIVSDKVPEWIYRNTG